MTDVMIQMYCSSKGHSPWVVTPRDQSGTQMGPDRRISSPATVLGAPLARENGSVPTSSSRELSATQR